MCYSYTDKSVRLQFRADSKPRRDYKSSVLITMKTMECLSSRLVRVLDYLENKEINFIM